MRNIFELLNGDFKNIQRKVKEDCLIPQGTILKVFCNPCYPDYSSDSFTMFLEINLEDFTYHKLLAAIDVNEGIELEKVDDECESNSIEIEIVSKEEAKENKLYEIGLLEIQKVSSYQLEN